MLYPLLTVAAGLLMAGIAGVSLLRCIREGGIFVNQARFVVSGILLALFFPLHDLSSSIIFKNLEPLGAGEDTFTLAYWASIALYATVQLVILPTQRELYSTYLADRLTRATADR